MADREPFHTGIQYIAAKVAASIGDEQRTMAWLDRLERTGLGDELEPGDFGSIAETLAFRVRAEKFARAAPPVGNARLWTETRCAGVMPEGTAWDPRRNELLISSGRQRNVFAIDRMGNCRPLLKSRDLRLYGVLGMKIDPSSDTLWVATTNLPGMLDPKPDDDGKSSLVQIDLATGAVLRAFALPRSMLNDVAIAADGTVYVTDTRGGRVMLLRPRGDMLEQVVPPNTFEGPNGIVVLDNGDLLVADFHGLSRVVAPASPVATQWRLKTPNDLYLGGIDGLAKSGSTIVGIQNLIGRARVWSIALDAEMMRVARADVLLRGHPDLRNPMTGVIVGDRYLFVSDPEVQKALPDGELTSLPQGRTGHRVLELAL